MKRFLTRLVRSSLRQMKPTRRSSSICRLPLIGDPEVANDKVSLRLQGSSLEVGVGGCFMDFSFASVTSIVVNTGVVSDGMDTLLVDFSNGNPVPKGGLFFGGGPTGTDELDILGPKAGTTYDLTANKMQRLCYRLGKNLLFRGLFPNPACLGV